MFPQQGYSNYNPMMPQGMVPPYAAGSMGYGAGMPPMAPNGLSRSRTEITTTTTTNVMPGMMNQGFIAGGGSMMNGYETSMMNNMVGGYGASMMNTVVSPIPPTATGFRTSGVGMIATNSNSRVLINGTGNASTSRVLIAPPIYNKAVIAQPRVESRIQYIPYQTKEIVYDTVEKMEVIPIQKTVTAYEQLKHIETIPVEKAVTDFYAVEYLTEFMPTTTSEKVIDYVQQEVINETVNYRPVDTQRIIPNPNGLSTSGVNIAGGNVCIPTGIATAGPGAAFNAGYSQYASYGQQAAYGQQGVAFTGPAIMTDGGVGSMVQSVNTMNPFGSVNPMNPVMNPMVQSVNPMINSTYSTAYGGVNPVGAQLFNGMQAQPLC